MSVGVNSHDLVESKANKMVEKGEEWDTIQFKVQMRQAHEDADWIRKWWSIYKMAIQDVKEELQYFGAYDGGNDKAIKERLFRTRYRNGVGKKGVPQFKNADFYVGNESSEYHEYIALDRKRKRLRCREIDTLKKLTTEEKKNTTKSRRRHSDETLKSDSVFDGRS